ncbi:hypothetical protein [Komagataeibacter rhaeticus]|uniref:Uncharacterized protein n=1 Tax=Komagataeibacter rhaeticus TaxID=215221 RepID=A0A858JIU1_9PROT|nr:hypothetical protein [Komagataeibacter rhaeticus]QIP34359.1 hypothetical protein GWK63_01565 [Komagataeibacter rhaeticus]QOC46871.1 hypothetical protein ICJ78_01565 [Komagataeibacter rhaeticus]WPP20745.1 hypothetical protein SCD25_09715 [Komagataeibacter rhaeticus]
MTRLPVPWSGKAWTAAAPDSMTFPISRYGFWLERDTHRTPDLNGLSLLSSIWIEY